MRGRTTGEENETYKKDLLLIQAAREAISANYDETKEMHTVGAAVRCKNGKVYVGVNVYSIHGACAEQVALGTAITQGERQFDTIVAVVGKRGERLLPPCGNCRQILAYYAPDCKVILQTEKARRSCRCPSYCPTNTFRANKTQVRRCHFGKGAFCCPQYCK